MTPRPTYIVTGGAGFVGANVAAALLAREPRPHVVVIDSFRSGSFATLVEACERREVGGGGAFDGEVIAASVVGMDWESLLERTAPAGVIHEGAITDTTVADEREMIRENTESFGPLLRACIGRQVPLVYASSAATYGTPPQARDRVPFQLDAAGRPSNVYGFSKWLMECEHRRVADEAVARGEPEPRVVGLRYFNVFGPGEARKGRMASMVHQLATQMLAGKRPRIFVDGEQARDQVYIDDVVECTLAAAGLGGMGGEGGGGAPPVPGVYNLGSGVATSFNRIIGALRTALGVSEAELPTEYFEMPADVRRFYQDYTCADISATEIGLGWKPRWRPAEAMTTYGRWLAGQARRGSAG